MHGIDWLEPVFRDDLACPICTHAVGHVEVLDVASLAPPHQMLRLLRCGACASVFYERQDIRDFSDLGQDRGDFWKFYVEEGAGVWETIWPLLAVAASGQQCTLLDVGCGFGFTLDFWAQRGKGPACGVELAEYGRVGRRLLGVEIYPELLQECAALSGRSFDIVYASEVIEHVPDPRAFAALLASRAAPDGVLVLTTPNGNFIAPGNTSPTMLAALAPGFHAFLFSASALTELLREMGFASVHVQEHGERLVAWASHAARSPHAVGGGAARREYMAYMAERVANFADHASPVWQGFAYRHVRDLVGSGNLAEATRVADLLCAVLKTQYGAEILDPERIVPRLAQTATLAEAGDIAPFFMPCFYYLLGVLAQHAQREPGRAARYYQGSAEATLACVARVGTIFHLEAISFLWPARVARARLALQTQSWSDAAREYARLASAYTESDLHAVPPPPAELVERDVATAIDLLVGADQRDLARTLAQAFRGYVTARYGPEACNIDGVERFIKAGADVPLDPLLLPYFDALDASWRADRALAERLFDEMIRVGSAHGAHPKCGLACSERVGRARRHKRALARAAPAPYSFSYTYKPPS